MQSEIVCVEKSMEISVVGSDPNPTTKLNCALRTKERFQICRASEALQNNELHKGSIEPLPQSYDRRTQERYLDSSQLLQQPSDLHN